MKNNKSIGLPNGPNEFLKDITRHISVEGYKRYSKDVNNPYNIIESGNITMEDVDFPVMGTDNLGNEQIMMPGMNYQFPGDSVLEVPIKQDGGSLPKAQYSPNYDYEVLYDIEQLVNKSLGDINKKARNFSYENGDGSIDNMRHASGGRYAAEAIQQKIKELPYVGGLLDFVGVDKAAGFIGANAMGVGHELSTFFGADERPFLAKIQEMGEDAFNNYVGSIVGSLDIDDSKKDEAIKYLSYNNLLPDGRVTTEKEKKDGFSEDLYFKDEEGKRITPEYKRGGSALPKAQAGVHTDFKYKSLPTFDPQQVQHFSDSLHIFNVADASEKARAAAKVASGSCASGKCNEDYAVNTTSFPRPVQPYHLENPPVVNNNVSGPSTSNVPVYTPPATTADKISYESIYRRAINQKKYPTLESFIEAAKKMPTSVYYKPPPKVKSKETTEEKTDSSKPIRSPEFSEKTVMNQTRPVEKKYTNLYTPGAAKLFPDYDPSKQTFLEGAEDYKRNHKKRGYQTGGSLPQYQDKGEVKEIMNLRDYVVTDAEKAYLNDNKDQFCFQGKCLESTRNAFNSTAGTILGVDDGFKTWKSMGATSAKGRPTAKMIKENPWFAGDTGDSAVDSWDAQGIIVNSGGVTVYNRNDPNSNYTAGKAAIGSIYSFGPSGRKDSRYKARNQGYSRKFNLQPSHHSAQVTGFNEKSNENILYDSYIGKYMTESELINYWKDSHINYELEAIGTPSNYKNLTREKLKNDSNFYNKITTSPYNVNVNTLKNATKDAEVQIKEDGKYRSPGFDQDAMENFSNSLSKNKAILMQELNLNDENYNKLANLSLALAMAESEGGSALSFLERWGDTQGLTQLNWDNIGKDEQLSKKMKNINLKLGKKSIEGLADLRDPAKSAIATMVYLSKGQGEQERMFKTGLNPSVRDFYDNTGLIDNLRSSSAKINKNGIYLDELNERIPWEDLSKSNAVTEMLAVNAHGFGNPLYILDGMQQYFDPGVKKLDFDMMDPEEITEYLNNITKEKQLETRAIADRYEAKLADDGRLVISMKTNGNKEDMSFPKRMGYYWQSPAALMTGDAEGKNVHASRIEHYYNSLSSPESLAQKKETPERGFKIGGELENNTVYKNYVNGDYTGSEMESKAEKVYDKLNRLHYKNSKKLGMTPANYILTHVVG